jgi:PAS domain-containing protein
MAKCSHCNDTKRYISIDGVEDVCPYCAKKGLLSKFADLFKQDDVVFADLLNNVKKLKESRSDIKDALVRLEQNEEFRILLHSLAKTAPIMQWAKDVNGVYTYANDALAKHLFDSDNGDDLIGKDDMEIVGPIIKKYPKWTFGTICVGTDKMTLEQEKPLKFFEWGIVKDNFEYVVAYKAPYYDKDGNLQGTTGIALYVTEEVEELIDIMNETKDTKTKNRLKTYLSRYGFGQDNTFSDINIEELWRLEDGR